MLPRLTAISTLDPRTSPERSTPNVNGVKYHAKNGQGVRKAFKRRCGKSYKTSRGLRHHAVNFPPRPCRPT
ncbi:juxtaposed with another zinc finger protein 1-like [Arapaima gigas]